MRNKYVYKINLFVNYLFVKCFDYFNYKQRVNKISFHIEKCELEKYKKRIHFDQDKRKVKKERIIENRK